MINKLLCLLGMHERTVEFVTGSPTRYYVHCPHCRRVL